jgi:hypothetical protein
MERRKVDDEITRLIPDAVTVFSSPEFKSFKSKPVAANVSTTFGDLLAREYRSMNAIGVAELVRNHFLGKPSLDDVAQGGWSPGGDAVSEPAPKVGDEAYYPTVSGLLNKLKTSQMSRPEFREAMAKLKERR